MSVRVAAIDCGTHSLRMLVAEVEPGSSPVLVDLDRRMRVVRLGEGVDRTGRLQTAAIDRTIAVLRDYAEVARHHGAERVRLVATSATRDSANAEVFSRAVHAVLGVRPDVVDGEEEAALSYLGAVSGLAESTAHSPRLVFDLGGGSTELVLGHGFHVIAAHSMDIGCVRMWERHFAGDPPSTEQVAAARADIDAALDEAERLVPLHRANSLIGLAGTVTTVTAMALGLSAYDPVAIHGTWVSASEVGLISDALLGMSRAQRAAIPVMHPGRVDVIAAGSLVLRRILDRSELGRVRASEHDILDGIALSMVRADG